MSDLDFLNPRRSVCGGRVRICKWIKKFILKTKIRHDNNEEQ